MPLDREFDPIVAAMAQRPQVPVAQLDPVQLRATVEAARWPTRRTELVRVEELRVDGGGGPIAARLYAPRNDAALPLVLFMHGGGFVICSLDTHDNYCRALAQAADCAVLSVDYRRAPEHRFPAAAEDAIAALRWARRHAATLGGDPQRMAVAGDSAGGNLAAVAALHAGVSLRHMLLLYPVIDPQGRGETWRTQARTPFLSAEMMRWFWSHYLRSASDHRDPYAAPLHADLSRAPQATILTAEVDPLCAEGEQFATALRAAGIDVDCLRYAGMPHGFATLVGMVRGAERALAHGARRLRAAFAP